MSTSRAAFAAFVIYTLAARAAVAASAPMNDAPDATEEVVDARSDAPTVAYAYTAYGARARTVGVAAYGLGSVTADRSGSVGGGASVWGSPIDRLTLIGDAQRTLVGDFTPSIAMIVRVAGSADDGFSLGALGKFKVDGFGSDAQDGIESEVELGLLGSYTHRGWHFDVNAIAGRGTSKDGETDAEARLRVGRDLGSYVRVGADGQVRARVAGPTTADHTWDFAAGPQVVVGTRHLFGTLTAGPTTTGTDDGHFGWSAMASVGGIAF